MNITEDNQNSSVNSVRKTAEFEAFLELIKSGKIEHWSAIAEALGVREATISEWKQHPLAKQAIAEGIQRCLDKMEEAGSNDWRMWREKLKILGVKDKETQTKPSSNDYYPFQDIEWIKQYAARE